MNWNWPTETELGKKVKTEDRDALEGDIFFDKIWFSDKIDFFVCKH